MFGNLNGSKSTYVRASRPVDVKVTSTWDEFAAEPRRALVLNGDSACLSIPDQSVDAVVTDPPYFDFVHYSELSDFFYAWLAPNISDRYPFFNRSSSYHEGEVQNKDPEEFAANLGRVFKECHRVLKNDGVLTFSFHHSRPEGWAAIYQALRSASFSVTAVHPVHAEMSVASPKSSAREPINLDMILVCKKSTAQQFVPRDPTIKEQAEHLKRQLEQAGLQVSYTDMFNIRASLLLVAASAANFSTTTYKNQV